MRKSIFSLTSIALVLLAGTSSANAASNAQLTVTANVQTATCDVSLSTNSLDLGTYSLTSFPGADQAITDSAKTFTVGLSNCEQPAAENDTASVLVTGQTIAGNNEIYNSTGTNTGVILTTMGGDRIATNSKVEIAKASATPAEGDFNAKTVSLQASLASGGDTPDLGAVSAPILFAFAYN